MTGTASFFGWAPSMEQPEEVMKFSTGFADNDAVLNISLCKHWHAFLARTSSPSVLSDILSLYLCFSLFYEFGL